MASTQFIKLPLTGGKSGRIGRGRGAEGGCHVCTTSTLMSFMDSCQSGEMHVGLSHLASSQLLDEDMFAEGPGWGALSQEG